MCFNKFKKKKLYIEHFPFTDSNLMQKLIDNENEIHL